MSAVDAKKKQFRFKTSMDGFLAERSKISGVDLKNENKRTDFKKEAAANENCKDAFYREKLVYITIRLIIFGSGASTQFCVSVLVCLCFVRQRPPGSLHRWLSICVDQCQSVNGQCVIDLSLCKVQMRSFAAINVFCLCYRSRVSEFYKQWQGSSLKSCNNNIFEQ